MPSAKGPPCPENGQRDGAWHLLWGARRQGRKRPPRRLPPATEQSPLPLSGGSEPASALNPERLACPRPRWGLRWTVWGGVGLLWRSQPSGYSPCTSSLRSRGGKPSDTRTTCVGRTQPAGRGTQAPPSESRSAAGPLEPGSYERRVFLSWVLLPVCTGGRCYPQGPSWTCGGAAEGPGCYGGSGSFKSGTCWRRTCVRRSTGRTWR